MAISDEDEEILRKKPKVSDLKKNFDSDNKKPEDVIKKKNTGKPLTTYSNIKPKYAVEDPENDGTTVSKSPTRKDAVKHYQDADAIKPPENTLTNDITKNHQSAQLKASIDENIQSHQGDASQNQDTKQLTQATTKDAMPSSNPIKEVSAQQKKAAQPLKKETKRKPSKNTDKFKFTEKEDPAIKRNTSKIKAKISPAIKKPESESFNVEYDDKHYLAEVFVLRHESRESVLIREIFLKLCLEYKLEYNKKNSSILVVDKENKCYINELALNLLIDNKLENDVALQDGTKLNKKTRLLTLFAKKLEAFANNPTSFIENERKNEIIEEIKEIAQGMHRLHHNEDTTVKRSPRKG